MKRIALLAQNRHDAESALLIARESSLQEWATVEFVSLDGFFQQRAESVFDTSGIGVRVVEPRRPLPAPFYRLPRSRRLAVVLANQRRLSRVAARFDAAIVGCDGTLERVLINSLSRRCRPAYLVINALHFSHAESRAKIALRRLAARLRLNHLFPSQFGQGMTDRVFAPGDHSRLELLELGVPADRIEVTGSPRFAHLVQPDLDPAARILERLAGPGPIRLLYLLGAWEWHGLSGELDREIAQLERCAEIAQSWPGSFELAARLHPRSSAGERARLESISGIRVLSADSPLTAELSRSDVVLAAVSTGLLEAIALGRLVLVLALSGIGRGVNLRAFEESGMWVSGDARELRLAFEELLSPGPELERRVLREVESLWHFISPDTPDAAHRILRRIRADLAA